MLGTVGVGGSSEEGPIRGLGIHLGNINKFVAGVSHDLISFSEVHGSSYGAAIEMGQEKRAGGKTVIRREKAQPGQG